MTNETLLELAPALVPLQASPITSRPVPHSATAASLIANNVPAATNLRIVPLYAESGKVVTFTAIVTTTSGEKPSGTVTFRAGSTILCAEAPLACGKASTKVSTSAVHDQVTAIYSGDERHASAIDVLAQTPSAELLKTAALEGHHRLIAPSLSPGAVEESLDLSTDIGGELISLDRLTQQITNLWSSHQLNGFALRSARLKSTTIRIELGEDLAAYKQILAKTGRDGKWTEFLDTIGIPRTTADRYIKKWILETSPKPPKRTTGAIDGPSKEEVACLVKDLTAKAKRVLTTDESVALFLLEISAALQPSVSVA